MPESAIWPVWPMQGNELMRLAVALLLAAVCGEAVARSVRLPRVTGYSLAGLLMGPTLLGWFGPEDLDQVRIAIDLALALLLFELGVRLDVRWFRANPWVLVSSVAEAGLAFVADLHPDGRHGLHHRTGGHGGRDRDRHLALGGDAGRLRSFAPRDRLPSGCSCCAHSMSPTRWSCPS